MDSPRTDTTQNLGANSLLPRFFRSLADKIENNRLNEQELKLVGEFLMSYMFNTESSGEGKLERENISDEEFQKFLILGWWIYREMQ